MNYLKKISKDFDQIKPLLLVAEQLKVPTGALVIPFMVLALICVFTGIAGNFLVTLLGFCYPAYMSFKALETTCKEEEEVGRESREAAACEDDR